MRIFSTCCRCRCNSVMERGNRDEQTRDRGRILRGSAFDQQYPGGEIDRCRSLRSPCGGCGLSLLLHVGGRSHRSVGLPLCQEGYLRRVPGKSGDGGFHVFRRPSSLCSGLAAPGSLHGDFWLRSEDCGGELHRLYGRGAAEQLVTGKN